MTVKSPLKLRILECVSDNHAASAADITRLLHEEYAGERHFSRKAVESHMHSLKTVGLVEESDVSLNENGQFVIKYQITENGQKRLAALKRGKRN